MSNVEKWLLKPKKLPVIMDFVRWVIVDIVRGKPTKFDGVYQFVGLPGEGKTLSMVAHIERAIANRGRDRLYIATNFYYSKEDAHIRHWVDMVTAARYAKDHDLLCIVALDEIHLTFDSTDWKNFPPELLALLSFNRKYYLQFLCSAQIYERIPKKIRDIGTYTVICRNVWGFDRYFKNYYFNKDKYETKFNGKLKDADMIQTYIATDELYALYDTMRQVDKMVDSALKEVDRRKEAFDLLFQNEREQHHP